MTSLISWIPPATISALGWALIHFLWQGTAIAALTAGLMQSCRNPQARYGIGIAALTLMLAAPLITFLLLVDGASGLASSALRFPVMTLPHPAPVLPWLVEVWACGVVLLSLRFAGNFLLLGQAHRRQSGAPSPHLLALCKDVQQLLGIHRAVRYLECNWLSAPAGFGILRPVILLPVAALTGLSEEQLRAVIAHELAHIRRWDFSVNLFQVAAETLLFYHPAIWWLNRRIRAEREICCDEIAVSACGNPLAYARALTLLAERRNAPAMAMAINQGLLTDRIFRLVRGEIFDTRSFFAGMAGSLLLLALSLAGGNALLAGRIPDAVHPPVLARVSEIAVPAAITGIRPAPEVKPHAAKAPVRRASIPSAPVTPPPEEDAAPAVQTDLPPNPIPVGDNQPVSPTPAIFDSSKNFALDDEYPVPALAINAPHSAFEWERPEASNYCDQFAQQTVVQGANRPFHVDDAARQRYAFFFWHCMQRNGQMEGGEGTPHAPAYQPAGTASVENPVNVSGGWAISLPPFAASRSCNFTQTGNSISGTCARSEGGGSAHGVVDGRQIRWSWTYLDDEKREAELDFIGTVGPDGTITGQSIQNRNSGFRGMIQPFTAVPGAPVTQVASQQ